MSVKERIERYATDLGAELPEGFDPPPERAVTILNGFIASLELRFEQTGEQAVADLSPQLAGLEGQIVYVKDEADSEPRRFVVGRTGGALPYHFEGNATVRARMEYEAVLPVKPA